VTVERVTKAKAVVTGWGLASAIGLEEGEVWEALKNGKSGVKIWPGYIYRNAPLPVGACDLERIEGELRKAGIELEHKEQRALVLALYVLNQALQQSPPQGEERKRILYVASSLTTSELLSERWGVYFSGGKTRRAASSKRQIVTLPHVCLGHSRSSVPSLPFPPPVLRPSKPSPTPCVTLPSALRRRRWSSG